MREEEGLGRMSVEILSECEKRGRQAQTMEMMAYGEHRLLRREL